MALESVIERLAYAIERGEPNIAVREIIRERDVALNNLRDMTNRRDYWEKECREQRQRGYAKDRRIASLKGVITRMKRAPR